MLCARATRWLYLSLVVLSAAVFVQAADTAGNATCNWYCYVEGNLDALWAQVDLISKILGLGTPSGQQQYTGSKPTKTATRYASTFGTPHASPTNYVPPVVPVVTVVSPVYLPPSTPSPIAIPKPAVESRNGYRAVGYYGNWDVYARKYFPAQIPADKLTHLLYSFADNKDDGTVIFSDTWADTDQHNQGDSWSDSGKNVYGSIKQLQILKQKNRNLKVMLSIGGWTYTNEKKHLDTPASTDQGRKAFAASCVNMIKNYGFDGIDVDWEYPQSEDQGQQFLSLLKEIRSAMDTYADTLAAKSTGYAKQPRPHYLLSIAAPAGKENYANLPLADIANVCDFINLMAYDFSGSWDKVAGHTANLAPSKSNPACTPYNADSVVRYYLQYMAPSKLNLGMPLYGRAFTNTAGLGQPYNGIGKGTWEAGVYDYKDLPLAGATEYFDAEAYATYSYDNSTDMLVSYDTVDMALTKCDYIKQNGLGGAMWWEVSGDRTDDKSIISSVVKDLAGPQGKGIESSPNWVYYPDSMFDNMKNGFAAA